MCLILFLCRNSISKLLNKIIKLDNIYYYAYSFLKFSLILFYYPYIYYFLKTIIKSTLVEL